MDLRDYIASIDDFPKSGIRFYDISTLLAHPSAWRFCVQQLVEQVSPLAPDLIIGIESRGFLTAAPVAYELGCGFAMMRKKGKLPGDVQFYEYELEYGNDTVEIQSCAIDEGQRVVIMDDLLATGGTVAAAIELIHKAGGEVAGACFIIELGFLAGRDRLNSYDVPLLSLVTYE